MHDEGVAQRASLADRVRPFIPRLGRYEKTLNPFGNIGGAIAPS
jgi:hypothetical protein